MTELYAERDLVQLIKASDMPSFSCLYDRYAGALYGIILQVTNNRQQAEKILVDVFIQIWRGIDNYEPSKGRLFMWMLHIARKEAGNRQGINSSNGQPELIKIKVIT